VLLLTDSPGSRIWKVGFSGEPEPRACFWAREGGEAWQLDLGDIEGARGDREEGRRIVETTVLQRLRETFVKHLMTDAKSRKVIILENTFLPVYVKDAIAKGLFENLRVSHSYKGARD
jgi:actin-related protein 10